MSAEPLPLASPSALFGDYSERLSAALRAFDWAPVERLARLMMEDVPLVQPSNQAA